MDKTLRFVDVPSIDEVREEAARCCDETARWGRGERGRVLNPMDDGILGEFSDAAFGVASEVAMAVAEAFRSVHVRFAFDMPWSVAASMLRHGWQRGHKIAPQVIKKGAAS